MGSSITEPILEMPDMNGLPVLRVNASIAKCVGTEVHIVKGQNLFGETHWTHVEIWHVHDIIRAANSAYRIASEQFGEVKMREICASH